MKDHILDRLESGEKSVPLDQERDSRVSAVPLQNGDVIRLQHVPTTRNLHSHSVAAPVTKLNNEVSCYGDSTVGDFYDYWVVEVVDDIKTGRQPRCVEGPFAYI